MILLKAAMQLDAAHAGHADITNHQAEVTGCGEAQRGGAGIGRFHRVPAALEQARQQLPDRDFVVHYQRRMARGGSGGGGRHRHVAAVGNRRQGQSEPGAAFGFHQIQRAAVRARDAVRNRQAEPGAFADLLGREERLEDAAAKLRADARAAVGNLDEMAALLRTGRDPDGARHAGCRHRVLRVQQQVEEQLLDLVAVDHRHQRLGRILRVDRDVALAQMIFAEIHGGADDRRQVGGDAIRGAAADEREQVAHDLAGARRFAADGLEIALVARRTGPVVQHQLDAADDRLERVVDLVSDARDQLADRRQPFAVHELIAQPQLLADVALDADVVRQRP
jgi:hypothetical protein